MNVPLKKYLFWLGMTWGGFGLLLWWGSEAFHSESIFTIPEIIGVPDVGQEGHYVAEMEWPDSRVLAINVDAKKLDVTLPDTLLLNYSGWKQHWEYNYQTLSDELTVFVDTSQCLAIDVTPSFDWINFEGSESELAQAMDDWKNDHRAYAKGYPVFIYANTPDTTWIEIEDGKIVMIQEAKNRAGEWQPIEYWINPFCGNSYSSIAITPGKFLLTQTVQYEGDFETELRVRMRNGRNIFYSNTFKGTINEAQFNVDEEDFEIFDFLAEPQKTTSTQHQTNN